MSHEREVTIEKDPAVEQYTQRKAVERGTGATAKVVNVGIMAPEVGVQQLIICIEYDGGQRETLRIGKLTQEEGRENILHFLKAADVLTEAIESGNYVEALMGSTIRLRADYSGDQVSFTPVESDGLYYTVTDVEDARRLRLYNDGRQSSWPERANTRLDMHKKEHCTPGTDWVKATLRYKPNTNQETFTFEASPTTNTTLEWTYSNPASGEGTTHPDHNPVANLLHALGGSPKQADGAEVWLARDNIQQAHDEDYPAVHDKTVGQWTVYPTKPAGEDDESQTQANTDEESSHIGISVGDLQLPELELGLSKQDISYAARSGVNVCVGVFLVAQCLLALQPTVGFYHPYNALMLLLGSIISGTVMAQIVMFNNYVEESLNQ